MTHNEALKLFLTNRNNIDTAMDDMARRASSINADFALTLHFSGEYTDFRRDFNDRQQAMRVLKLGLNNMGKKLYGKGGVLKRSVFIERANGVGLHAHMIFKNECTFSDSEIKVRLWEGWAKTRGAHKGTGMFNLDRVYDLNGWSDYMSKSMRHANWDNWDVSNSNI
jgi:hypothetical protein